MGQIRKLKTFTIQQAFNADSKENLVHVILKKIFEEHNFGYFLKNLKKMRSFPRLQENEQTSCH